MSYMTPYYFSASANQPISIWMRSNDFEPKVGLAFSGSTTKLAENSASAWQYDSIYSCAAIRYTLPSSSVYKIESTSTVPSATGSFKLYVTAAETSSVNTTNIGTPWRLVYSPNANRIFSVEWVFTDTTPTCSVSIIDPQTSTVINTFQYTSSVMFDGLYNSVNDTVCVWVSSSAGEFLDEYDGSGSVLINSYPVTTSWTNGDPNNKAGQMVYNPTLNQALLIPSANTALSWSVYDFTTQTNVWMETAGYTLRYPIYVSSTGYYYAVPFGDNTNAATKISASNFSSSVVTHMTGSGYGAAYIEQIDRILYEDETPSSCSVYDAQTDNIVAKIPGIIDLQYAVFDTCRNCIVISDDAAGDPTYTQGGGLCYVSTGSYQPLNFVYLFGAYNPVYCTQTSTVWVANYYDQTVLSIFSSVPTGSLPQPPYPTPSTGSLPAFCVVPPFTPFILSSSISAPVSVSLDSFGTGSVALWARSSDFDTYLNVYDPSGNWLASNDWGGFMPSPDIDDAAINFPTTQSGVYEIQLSSSAAYGAGNFELYVSPGANRKVNWTDRYGRCVFWISSSNTVGVVTDQNSVVFYDVATQAITYQYAYQGTYGGAYSQTQDRVFAWVVGDAPGFDNIMVEYDNTGVQLSTSSFDAQIFWGGSTCYDDFNDRMFLVRTFGLSGPWAVWDCSTKTITQSGSVNTHGTTTYCTYANVNDRYYISFHNLSNNNAMEWVDAATYVTGTTATTMHDYLQYEPATKQIVATRNGGVIVMDPVTDTTTTTFTDYGTFEGVVFDPCTQNMAALVDFNGAGGIITLDPSASYQVTNYIPVYSDTSDFTYGICHAESTSRLYLTSDDFNTGESSLWDCKVTYPTTIITGIPGGVIEITASLPP